jgi:hypothetical protein
VVAGVGVDLGPISATVPIERTPISRASSTLTNSASISLRNRRRNVAMVSWSMVVRGDEAERHRIVGGPFQFAARKYVGGAAVQQEAQQHRRVIRSRTQTATALAHRAQIQSIHHLHHETR